MRIVASSARNGVGESEGSSQRVNADRICFIISEFGGYFDEYYKEVFRPAIEAAGLAPVRADSLFRSSDIVSDIWHFITTCRIALADLTGRNPNVFYELGLAHAATKPVLLLTQDIQDVPFDLRQLRIINYDTKHPKWAEMLREGITNGLKETLASPRTAVLPTFLQERPGQRPSISTDEKRFLQLQQGLSALRAEVRASLPETVSKNPYELFRQWSLDRTTAAGQAQPIIEALLSAGLPPTRASEVLVSAGVPAEWAKSWIREALLRQSAPGEESGKDK